ncbi:zinc-binding domain-containing protein [Xylaria intraflava]|nr:zinc-binding domain-containing protein [Xylaria intraflava]
MAKKQRKMPVKWSMYARKDNEVAQLLEEDGLSFKFHPTDSDTNAVESYDTNIMGKFVCRNEECKAKPWSSRQIAITIRMYPGNEYNARVYHQHCKHCKSLSQPILDASYAERVAYRLKKWSGIRVQPPPFKGKSGKPHKSDLCEGCKAGHCIAGNYLTDMFDGLRL